MLLTGFCLGIGAKSASFYEGGKRDSTNKRLPTNIKGPAKMSAFINDDYFAFQWKNRRAFILVLTILPCQHSSFVLARDLIIDQRLNMNFFQIT